MTQVDQSWVSFNATGEDHFLESKKLMCLRPENEIPSLTFFAKTSTAKTNRSAFASPTERQDPGEHCYWFKVSSSACILPIFAKAPCCLESFGCCCRRLSQHGVGEVLILLRDCWRDAFFCVCVGSGSFCQFCFGLLMRCLFLDSPSLRPSGLLTHATRRALWTLRNNLKRLVSAIETENLKNLKILCLV